MSQEYIEVSSEELWNEVFPKASIENKIRVDRDGKPKTAILLGAGFTNKYIPNTWGYDNIWDYASRFAFDNDEKDILELMDNYFKEMGNKNFERLIALSNECTDFLNLAKKPFKIFLNSKQILRIKEVFINAMHNAGIDSEKRLCNNTPAREIGSFLTRFDQVFTTNYDPLVYWSIMKHTNSDENRYTIGDFFHRGEYAPENPNFVNAVLERDKTLVSYLHGAFFNTDTDSIYKISTSPDSDESLMKLAKKRYGIHNIKPLIVTDGSSEQKILAIDHNRYLSDSLSRLRRFDLDYLCTIGFGFTPPDKHIIDSIRHNRPSKIAIGYYGEIGNNMKKFIKDIMQWNPKCEIMVFKTNQLPCDETPP